MNLSGQPRAALEGLETPEVRQEVTNLPYLAVIGFAPGGKIVFWNRGAQRLLGYEAEQVLDTNLEDLLRTPGQKAWSRTMLEATSAVPMHRVTLHHRNGKPVGCLAHTEPGDTTCYLMLSRRPNGDANGDGRNLPLDRGLDSLAVLAGGIAHDFNNLLLGMVGHADLALMELPGDHGVREHVEQIAQAGLQAADLCRQLMAFSGKSPTVKEPLDITDLVHHASPLVRMSLGTAVLNLELAADLPQVEGDGSQLRQVLMNLVTNAAESFEPGTRGQVTIRTQVREVGDGQPGDSELPRGHYVVLEIEDDGAGMAPEHVDRAFEPFFSTKFMGRGLGLAAAQGIVRAHHGSIRICSDPDSGTRVTVALPVKGLRAGIARPRPQDTETAAPRRTPSHQRVLVVDDEAHVRNVARGILVRAGFEVEQAEHGGAALAFLADDPAAVDLVLLDMTMPGLDGLEVLERIRQMRPDLPVLLSSGYGMDAVDSGFADDPACHFLAKPYRRQNLVDAVSELLHSNEAG